MLLNRAGNQETVNYSLLKYRSPPIRQMNRRRLMILSAGEEVGKRIGNRLTYRAVNTGAGPLKSMASVSETHFSDSAIPLLATPRDVLFYIVRKTKTD